MTFADAYAELARICPAAFVLKVEAWHHVGESGAHRDAPLIWTASIFRSNASGCEQYSGPTPDVAIEKVRLAIAETLVPSQTAADIGVLVSP